MRTKTEHSIVRTRLDGKLAGRLRPSSGRSQAASSHWQHWLSVRCVAGVHEKLQLALQRARVGRHIRGALLVPGHEARCRRTQAPARGVVRGRTQGHAFFKQKRGDNIMLWEVSLWVFVGGGARGGVFNHNPLCPSSGGV